jgi:hypothetical protein
MPTTDAAGNRIKAIAILLSVRRLVELGLKVKGK